MTVLTVKEKSQICQQVRPFGVADRLLSDTANYDFDLSSVENYDSSVKEEIASGISDLRSLRKISPTAHLRSPSGRAKDLAVNSMDPVERDQALWDLASHCGTESVSTLIRSIEKAPTREAAVSGILGLHKIAHHDPIKVADFIMALTSHPDVEIAEWARLSLIEMAASGSHTSPRLNEPCSERDFVHDPSRPFDVTMPLIFQCHAYTKVGPATLHTVISPAWFSQIFGRAMACIRQETFYSQLVLEKLVENLHPDGSPHFEHFPFSGTTKEAAPGVFQHNYWAQLYRPYYTSGRTEVVTAKRPVIPNVPMTFCRQACTYAPERYWVNNQPIPESVRGLFFGYGHIEPKTFIKSNRRVKAGDFQLSSKINPATGKPANTYFYGTFFGKLCDWDGDGKLDINTRPVHCDITGSLDYDGDGTMRPDPIRPADWEPQQAYTKELLTRC
jgi:hypothetical protein